MNKNIKILVGLVVVAALFVSTNIVLADEVVGQLGLGFDVTSGTGLQGDIAPAENPAPSPSLTVSSSRGSSGGGGGFIYLSADANRDRKVDALDFVILMANWGQTDVGNIADFNHSNTVDVDDLIILMSQWTA